MALKNQFAMPKAYTGCACPPKHHILAGTFSDFPRGIRCMLSLYQGFFKEGCCDLLHTLKAAASPLTPAGQTLDPR
jgi:hypothetical protein